MFDCFDTSRLGFLPLCWPLDKTSYVAWTTVKREAGVMVDQEHVAIITCCVVATVRYHCYLGP